MNHLFPRMAQENALADVEARLRAGEDALSLMLERADLLAALGRIEEAKQAYLEILTAESAHFGALNNFGAMLYGAGFRTAARTAYAEAVTQHPGNPTGHVNLANAMRENGELTSARQHYEAALGLAPDHPEAHQGMAYILTDLGEEERASAHRERGFKDRAVTVLPYRGAGDPVSILLLISAAGGNVPIRPQLDEHIFLTTVLVTEFFNPDAPLPSHQLVFNSVGDADLCRTALARAAHIIRKTSAPVINAPSAVSATGREDNARRLGELKGVVAANTMSFSRAMLTPGSLAEHGFSFPILLRRAGFHTGQYFERVANLSELEEALKRLAGETLTVIRYLDARHDDGKFRKFRVMMIDGKLYPLHAAISSDWKVHYFTAEMAENEAHRAEDARFLEDMPQVLGPKAMRALEQIQATLGLDYAGIDFGLSETGEIILFEANATMTVNPPESGARWNYRRAPVSRILDAVRTMIMGKL